MDPTVLESAGLTLTESKVYLDLLKNGSSLAGRVSRNTGIHRRSVYDAIERLTQKGLVSYIKSDNKKMFEAVDPSRLLEIIKEREEALKKIVPELTSLKGMAKVRGETLFFRGKSAIKSVFDDQLSVGKDILILAASIDVSEYLEVYFNNFDKQRAKKNIRVKLLFEEKDRAGTRINNIPLSEIRFAPDGFASPMSINVYGDHVSIVLWRESIAILINEKTLAEGFRNYFNFMWSFAKE
jgi:HTH-type transcriptional regulator, sugar sensing transcriptional regulator